MLALLSRLFETALSIASPPRCMACDASSRSALCVACAALLHAPAAREVAGVPLHAAALYASPIDDVIQRFKYDARPDLARGLASLFAPELDLSQCLLVPVPLHPGRLAERGYNQAALLAAALARRHGGRVAARALVRTRDTRRQAMLGRAERLANPEAAFRSRRALSARRVLLVDDVVTTGATAASCVAALRQAGAEVAGVLAIASAEPFPGRTKGHNPSTQPNFLADTLCGVVEKM